jgi:hypothetical protein
LTDWFDLLKMTLRRFELPACGRFRNAAKAGPLPAWHLAAAGFLLPL